MMEERVKISGDAEPARTVAVTTLGCKSNQYDSSAIEDALAGDGLRVLPFPSPADAYVINTCTVTRKTDYQSRQLVRKVRRLNPSSVVIVTGCYAQVSPDEVQGIDGVDYVLGNPEKDRVVEFIRKGRSAGPAEALIGRYADGAPMKMRAASSSGRTRANLKVQDGCDRFCTYCIIPRARGVSRSLPLSEVEREIERLIEAGFKEVVLTGIHLGAWGSDLDPSKNIIDIIRLVEKMDTECRFRISSLDPDEVTDELVDLLSTGRKVCNHMHLPLQSGDRTVLERMKRSHTPETFAERVTRLHESVPGISIGTDVIAGFPGEGEREFLNTLSLLEDLPVSYMHIFPYSARSLTPAAGFSGRVNGAEVKKRCALLKELDAEKRAGYLSRFIGARERVLIERTDKGAAEGKTSNYIKVRMAGGGFHKNTFVDVVLKKIVKGCMTAERARGPERRGADG